MSLGEPRKTARLAAHGADRRKSSVVRGLDWGMGGNHVRARPKLPALVKGGGPHGFNEMATSGHRNLDT